MTTATAGGNRLCRTVGAREQRTQRGTRWWGGAVSLISDSFRRTPHVRGGRPIPPPTVRTAGADFVHGVSGLQKSRGRRTLMRACVRACASWKYARLVDWKKGTPPERRDDGVRGTAARGGGGRWFLKYIDKRVEASSALAAAAAAAG